MKERIIFITGPTAAGKTEVAAELAKKLKTEIISCDSMQVYRGMDIISCKPGAALRKKIRHHLLGAVSPEEEYDVFRFRREALKKISALLKKGKTPLLAGGTGLYISALIDGIFDLSKQDNNLRRRLYKEIKRRGSIFLHRRLEKVDPQAAKKIHPHDARRIVRALEVFFLAGRPISEMQRERQGLAADYALRIFCLDLKRSELYRRIDTRVDKMFAQCLVGEVRSLLKKKLSKTSSSAIGIKEIKGHFDGLYDLEEAGRLIKRNTRRYAKRQMSWFRRDKRIIWIKISQRDSPRKIAAKIWKKSF